MHWWEKLKGEGAVRPSRSDLRSIALAWLGGFLAIGAVAWLASIAQSPLVLGSFGATCVLAFGFPDLPFSQPRHIAGGHFIASLVGLLFFHFVGPDWCSMALATATAIAAMMATRTVHPPAGSNPVIVFLTRPGWEFLLFPTLAGVLILLVVALLYNNLVRPSRYPKYW